MRYLFIDANTIVLATIKKNFVGQYETGLYRKQHQTRLIGDESDAHVDIVASAITEAMSTTPSPLAKDKDITLILPQNAFLFFRCEIPSDLSPNAIPAFIQDKVLALYKRSLSEFYYDFYLQDNNKKKQLFCYLMEQKKAVQWKSVFQLLNLKLLSVIPESLCYFTLFEKTVRQDKHEYFMYATIHPRTIHGYIYDSFGPLEKNRFTQTGENEPDKQCKAIIKELGTDTMKLNRLIVSGPVSDHIRQDTFTKEVGVWTNPLKRIIPQFYADSLKQLFLSGEKRPFPYLEYDVCFGAFIFTQNRKQFSVLHNVPRLNTRSRSPGPSIHLPMKEIFIGIASFVLSFGLFVALFKFPWSTISKKTEPKVALTSPTPSPIPSPTIQPVNRKDYKIKVLNGSGIAGKASDAKDFLKTKGYEEILTGNADTFDYATTVVQVKKNSPLRGVIESDLAPVTTTVKIEDLIDSDPADAIITIGKDWK